MLKILREEGTLWYKISRVNWIAQGDRNTKFFHLSTIIRRKLNAIKLKVEGDWVEDQGALKTHMQRKKLERNFD